MADPISLEHLGAQSVEISLGIGIGTALGRSLAPIAEKIAQSSWDTAPIKAVDAGTAAEIVAEDVEQMSWGLHEARLHGIDDERFTAIVGEVLNAPGIGELLRMIRRGTIDGDAFLHGMRKAKMETRWDHAVEDLQHERLDPAVIATAIQRGIIDDPGLLPVGPPSARGKVAPMPRADIDALKEARAGGYDRERLATITRIVGLPPAPGELLQLLNRGDIDDVDFYRGVSEGNTRNEWGPALIKLRRRLLTPHEYVEAHLRAWIDEGEMHSGAALSGLNRTDTDLLFKVLGRPISFHQVFIGLRRGGDFGADNAGIHPAFLKSLQESNIRPEWYQLAWAQRYVYPNAFILRRLAQDGALTTDEFERVLLYEGWEPGFAKKVADHYTRAVAATADPYIGKAQTQLWTALHKSYVNEESDDAVARDNMDAIGITDKAQPRVLHLWQRERALTTKTLTPSQIRKAYTAAELTLEEAVTRLEQQGYNEEDAHIFLTETAGK